MNKVDIYEVIQFLELQLNEIQRVISHAVDSRESLQARIDLLYALEEKGE